MTTTLDPGASAGSDVGATATPDPAAPVPATPDPAAPAFRPGLYRFAVFFAGFVLLHIKGGALVTSSGAGMAFTDWPLARGSLWPPDMDLEDYFEHLHRVSGSLVGLFGIVLLVWLHRVDPRRWIKRLSIVLLGMIIVQGILGGLGVTMGEAEGVTWWPAAVGHGTLAQPTLCVAAFIALALSRGWGERIVGKDADVRGARKLGAIALGAVFLQVLVGAIYRHTSEQGALWLHVSMAVVVSAAVVLAASWTGGRFGDRSRGFRLLGRWVYGLLTLQFLLGFYALAVVRPKDPSNIEYLTRSLLVSGHVLIGATLFLLATLILAKSWQNLVPASEARPGAKGGPNAGAATA